MGFKHAVLERFSFQTGGLTIKPPTPGSTTGLNRLGCFSTTHYSHLETLQTYRKFQFRLTKAISRSAEDPRRALALLYPVGFGWCGPWCVLGSSRGFQHRPSGDGLLTAAVTVLQSRAERCECRQSCLSSHGIMGWLNFEACAALGRASLLHG